MIELTVDYEILTAIATLVFIVVISVGAIFMICYDRKEK